MTALPVSPPERDQPTPTATSAVWYDTVACRDVDVNVFYPPDNERGVLAARRLQRAKQICRRCPVIDICLSVALASAERHGVWGGLSPEERLRLARASSSRTR